MVAKYRTSIWWRPLLPPGALRVLFAGSMRGMPPALLRALHGFAVLWYAVVAASLVLPLVGLLDAYHVVGLQPGQLRAMFLGYFCALPCVCCVFVLGKYLRIRAFRELLRKADYELCLRCGYSLRGLPGRHTCPECGVEYEIGEVQKQWEHWFGDTKRTPPSKSYDR